MTLKEELDTLIEKKELTQEEAYNLFDRCGSIPVDLLTGDWLGYELKSGHPMDGMLTAAGWYGKSIKDSENVQPLLFKSVFGKIFAGNPGLMPIQLFENAPRVLIKILFPFVSIFIRTSKPHARLRMLEYRGITSAAMLYDQKPIFDMFRKVDENTLLGVTDLRWNHDLGCFFVLVRNTAGAAQ